MTLINTAISDTPDHTITTTPTSETAPGNSITTSATHNNNNSVPYAGNDADPPYNNYDSGGGGDSHHHNHSNRSRVSSRYTHHLTKMTSFETTTVLGGGKSGQKLSHSYGLV